MHAHIGIPIRCTCTCIYMTCKYVHVHVCIYILSSHSLSNNYNKLHTLSLPVQLICSFSGSCVKHG